MYPRMGKHRNQGNADRLQKPNVPHITGTCWQLAAPELHLLLTSLGSATNFLCQEAGTSLLQFCISSGKKVLLLRTVSSSQLWTLQLCHSTDWWRGAISLSLSLNTQNKYVTICKVNISHCHPQTPWTWNWLHSSMLILCRTLPPGVGSLYNVEKQQPTGTNDFY